MGKVSLKLADEYEDEELLLEKLNNDDDQLNQKSMHKEEIVERAQWTNELEYIMATIGFAIGKSVSLFIFSVEFKNVLN